MAQRLEDLLFALEEQFWLKSADAAGPRWCAYVHDGRHWKLAFHQQTPLS